ncbi:hypothetical protein OHS33_33515 [Streptomyces sp. NBC_00536]|uniref:hypothetical protein n=1 Tax=Streptomyces sp. NBC_00536 TaxID=2975769 RepID=UPI002E7FDA4B|nr:hypothetical protein [Streptomyces sp. NBC_00536]WUC82852.1 hypothetical protein OHS33_33515 [Streptomyces sp. NBC_00536]
MSLPLLRLYPAKFRREFGEEMAEAYREATEGAGRWTRFQEACDIAAHALRLRLGLGSAQRGGRLFAAASPFALAATASYSAFDLVSTVSDWQISDNPDFLVPLTYATGGGHLVALIGAVVALSGRHSGALWALAGLVGGAVSVLVTVLPADLPVPWQLPAFLLLPMVPAVLPLACPPDLRPARRIRSTSGVLALALWAPLAAFLFALLDSKGIGLFVHWRYGVPVIAALALAGRSALSGLRTAPQVVVAALPFMITGFFGGVLDQDSIPTALLLLAGAALAVRLWRSRNSGTATPT